MGMGNGTGNVNGNGNKVLTILLYFFTIYPRGTCQILYIPCIRQGDAYVAIKKYLIEGKLKNV
jgi:hypothetical protein